jgi:hypothetical protein
MVGVTIESQKNPKDIYKVGFNTLRLLLTAGELIISWLLLRQADIAQSKLANAGQDTDFYNGKIASAKFFVLTNLVYCTRLRLWLHLLYLS